MKTTQDFISAADIKIQEEPIEYGFSPTNGPYTARSFKGQKAEIQAQETLLRSYGYETSVKEGALWSLSAKISNDTNSDGTPKTETPIPTFELLPTKIDKDLLESNCAFVSYLKPEILRTLKETVKDNLPPSFLTSSYNSGLFSNVTEKTIAADVYLHYINGVTNYTTFSQTLRKTYNASSAHVVAESMFGVNNVWSTAKLQVYENVPSNIHNIMLSSGLFQVVIPNTFNLPTYNNIVLYCGWLKGCPTYNQIGPNQFQITVDFEYGYWSNRLYGAMLVV